MLLIDGVKYNLWTPPNEEEFERVVKEHTQEIFGKQSIYFDRKQMLKLPSGIGTIPDGYVIMFGNPPQWHIVEVELSSHDLYGHIVPQVTKFSTGINNLSTQRDLVNAINHDITKDEFSRLKLTKAIGTGEIYKFLSDLISQSPILTIIIEKSTRELEDVKKTLSFLQIKVVEFQTFIREGAEAVHAHLFEPIYKLVIRIKNNGETPPPPPSKKEEITPSRKGRKVTFAELVSAGLLRDGQTLCFYHTRPFIDERAQVVASSNQLKYEVDGRVYSKSELAKILLIKHGFKHDEYGVAGPNYWKTEDGKLLFDLEEQIRHERGDRT